LATASPTSPATPSAAPGVSRAGVPTAAEAATVAAIIDGDTLAVRGRIAGKVFTSTAQITVRLLEVDTPETKHPSKPVECFGAQATTFLSQIVPVGSTVWAVPDVERTDRYGRDLLYLWNANGAFVNLEIVRTGHGRAVLYEPNDRYITPIRAAEAEAKTAKRGLWGACSATSSSLPASPSPSASRLPSASPPAGGVYYAGCSDARSAGAAPIRSGEPGYRGGLDGDGDGLACE